jgi:hypothetical protein
MDVGFKRIKWFKNRSAWQDMEYHRKRRAEAIKHHLELMDAVNTALSGAQQNRITGMSSNAAQAALARIQTDAKAKSAEITKQVDSAQSLVDQTQSSVPEASGTSTMLDTVV